MKEGSEFAVAAHWPHDFDETALEEWAKTLRQRLRAPRVSLGLVFMAPRFFDKAAQILELLRVRAQVPLLVGCSSQGLIANDEELEEQAGIALGLYALPGTQLQPFHFTQAHVDEASEPTYWPSLTSVTQSESNGWLVFADPFHLDGEAWMRSWNESYAPKPTLGGLASGDPAESRTQVYWNEQVLDEGGIAVSFSGDVGLSSVISQGCTPIGETWTITRAEQNLILEIGNRPAYEVIVKTFNDLSAEEQKRARGNLFVGLVMNEYLEEFHRGDFLIRNLLGADPKSGAIAVGALPRAGQTIQFQRRDAAAATEDLHALLLRAKGGLGNARVYGGCLCSCNGRGSRLFGERNHDAHHVQEQLGPMGLTGFFCNGEIGPVGDKNFLHGYTASVALFVGKGQGERTAP